MDWHRRRNSASRGKAVRPLRRRARMKRERVRRRRRRGEFWGMFFLECGGTTPLLPGPARRPGEVQRINRWKEGIGKRKSACFSFRKTFGNLRPSCRAPESGVVPPHSKKTRAPRAEGAGTRGLFWEGSCALKGRGEAQFYKPRFEFKPRSIVKMSIGFSRKVGTIAQHAGVPRG